MLAENNCDGIQRRRLALAWVRPRRVGPRIRHGTVGRGRRSSRHALGRRVETVVLDEEAAVAVGAPGDGEARAARRRRVRGRPDAAAAAAALGRCFHHAHFTHAAAAADDQHSTHFMKDGLFRTDGRTDGREKVLSSQCQGQRGEGENAEKVAAVVLVVERLSEVVARRRHDGSFSNPAAAGDRHLKHWRTGGDANANILTSRMSLGVDVRCTHVLPKPWRQSSSEFS